jgi:hypothetical protein
MNLDDMDKRFTWNTSALANPHDGLAGDGLINLVKLLPVTTLGEGA